jgi:hypothetical protein
MRPSQGRRSFRRYLVLLTAALGVGCGRPHVKGTVAVETVLKAWTAEGFDTKGVVNLDPDNWSAGACSRGTVSGVDVLMCEYATDEALAVGEKKIMTDWAEESVGTGAAVHVSRTILAIADRNKTDPSGRTIARLIKTFRAQH